MADQPLTVFGATVLEFMARRASWDGRRSPGCLPSMAMTACVLPTAYTRSRNFMHSAYIVW